MEHFVTLFDSGFLPQALSLHASLRDQAEPFRLWAICMDAVAEQALVRLGYEDLQPIPLSEVEAAFPALLGVKGSRSRGEYCWTMTPFSYAAVWMRDPEASRVTYLDADLCFYGPASSLLAEMDANGADALITDHAYAPEYRQEGTSGRFCVQFLPLRNTVKGREIASWWQDRCIEWCFARFEDGKFGDQKYLDDWDVRWPGAVRVLEETTLTQAPWNASHLHRGEDRKGIYHFHNLRLYRGGLTKLWHSYSITASAETEFYRPYVKRLKSSMALLGGIGIDVPLGQGPEGTVEWLRRLKRSWKRTEGWARV